jgi:hypothetical protein
MGSKIWFCALCSEGFTRKYSANRHDQNLHRGQGKIVRMIDYIIGRLAGNYNPGNPLTYRSRYKQMDSSLARSDSKAFSFPLDSKISIAHDSFQRNSSSDLPPHSKEHALDQQQQQPRSLPLLPQAKDLQQSLIEFKNWPELFMAMKRFRLC